MPNRSDLRARFSAVRAATEALAAPLTPEDQQLQSMPACSPTKWHRGHTTWFFETFVLGPRGIAPYAPAWGVLFNSYYVGLGPRHARDRRGLLSRPSAEEVRAWRRVVDERVDALLAEANEDVLATLAPLIALGIAHEEQHQELLLTDILHAFAASPLRPAYRGPAVAERVGVERLGTVGAARPDGWEAYDGGVVAIGAATPGLVFDNEGPRHKVWLAPFSLATRLVTVGEAKAFARDGGYGAAALWMSDGFDWVRANGVTAPGYVTAEGDTWLGFGLDGLRELADDEPIAHVSWYEADAIARWLGARLPTEAEWEHAAGDRAVEGNFRDSGALRPLPGGGLFGDVWQWTASPYTSYPGYRPAAGAVGEYNGKFMANQLVLRGGSCLSPPGHLRATYRNFWPADTRFQMTGLRLARDGA